MNMLITITLLLVLIDPGFSYNTIWKLYNNKLWSFNKQYRSNKKNALLMSSVQQVSGDEGLLDTNRMERAYRGSGIKVPENKKLNVGIIGGGLAGMITAMELSEAGHNVEIFDSRRFPGGKVGSWVDKDGNHVEMGLHVFFGCYYNLFGIMKRIGALQNLRLKEHTHTFINEGGRVGMLDFRILGTLGAPFNGLASFALTEQLDLADKFANAIALATSPVVRALFDFDGALQDIRNLDNISFSEWFIGKGGSRGSIERMWDPIAYALGFMDCDNTSARCMLTIFQLFAVRTEASILRMLEGSPHVYLHEPIIKYLTERGVELNLNQRVLELLYDKDDSGKPTKIRGFVTEDVKNPGQLTERNFDVVVAATDVPGIKKLLPADFRKYNEFDKIYNLDAVPVQTVQLRFNGWVTELQDKEKMRNVAGDQSNGRGAGIDNLLYSPDAEFSCFADLAITSPADYYKEGEGSLMQCVLTPGDKWMPVSTEDIAMETLKQVKKLFPSARELECTWWNVVKLGQSLYREAPGMDVNRPDQVTPVPNFFLAGSYTFQDYIDSMEGATKSGLLCSEKILKRTDALNAFKEGEPYSHGEVEDDAIDDRDHSHSTGDSYSALDMFSFLPVEEYSSPMGSVVNNNDIGVDGALLAAKHRLKMAIDKYTWSPEHDAELGHHTTLPQHHIHLESNSNDPGRNSNDFKIVEGSYRPLLRQEDETIEYTAPKISIDNSNRKNKKYWPPRSYRQSDIATKAVEAHHSDRQFPDVKIPTTTSLGTGRGTLSDDKYWSPSAHRRNMVLHHHHGHNDHHEQQHRMDHVDPHVNTQKHSPVENRINARTKFWPPRSYRQSDSTINSI